MSKTKSELTLELKKDDQVYLQLMASKIPECVDEIKEHLMTFINNEGKEIIQQITIDVAL